MAGTKEKGLGEKKRFERKSIHVSARSFRKNDSLRNEAPEVNKSCHSLILFSFVFTKVARGLISESRAALRAQKTQHRQTLVCWRWNGKWNKSRLTLAMRANQLTESTNNWWTKRRNSPFFSSESFIESSRYFIMKIVFDEIHWPNPRNERNNQDYFDIESYASVIFL